MPLEESLGAFADLVAAGKVGTLGASNHRAWRVERARGICNAHGWPAYECIQQRYSYLQPRPGVSLPEWALMLVGPDILDYVRSEPGMTLFAYSTLISGAYTRPDNPLPEHYDHPGTTRRLAALHEVARELGATPNQVVLAWLIGGDPPIVPIVGASTVAQLEESLAALELELDHELRARLDAAT